MGNFKIREFRKANGILQSEMAEALDMVQPNLSRYENNNLDLTDEMLDKLRSKYGKEKVDAYLTDTYEQIRNKEVPEDKRNEFTIIDLVTIVKKQNETITRQMDTLNEFTQQLASMNVRLLDLLEKIQFN